MSEHRVSACGVLDSAGYTTVALANGPEALRAAAAMPTLDVVVTDVMMADMSGCELVRHLRRDNPNMKALYVTGYRDQLFGEKVMMWEDEAFIDKPCSIQALLEAVSLLWCARVDGSPRLSSSIELAPEDLQPASPLVTAIVPPQPMSQAEASHRNRQRRD